MSWYWPSACLLMMESGRGPRMLFLETMVSASAPTLPAIFREFSGHPHVPLLHRHTDVSCEEIAQYLLLIPGLTGHGLYRERFLPSATPAPGRFWIGAEFGSKHKA